MQLHGGAPARFDEACPLVARPENLTYRGFWATARRAQAGAHRLPTGGSVVGLPWAARRYVGGPLRSGKAKGSDFEVAARGPEAASTAAIFGVWENPPSVFILCGNQSFLCGRLLIAGKVYRNSPAHYETTQRKDVLSRPIVVVPVLSWLSGGKSECYLKLFIPCAVHLSYGFLDFLFKGVSV